MASQSYLYFCILYLDDTVTWGVADRSPGWTPVIIWDGANMQFTSMKTTCESLNADLGFRASEWSEWIDAIDLRKLTLELRIKLCVISDFP